MNRRWIFGVPVLLSILLTGCPFSAKTPIGDPVPGSLDTRLLGTWFWTDGKSGQVTEFGVFRFNESEYYLEIQDAGKEAERSRMYIVTVGGEKFLQVNDLTDDPAAISYTLARYSVSETGDLTVRVVGEKTVPQALASDRKGLVSFLASHLDGTDLDDPDGLFVLRR